MVVSAQHLASEAGAEVLRAGGNAVDAAVAVGYALAVVDPCCGNIGGGGFMTLHLADGHASLPQFPREGPGGGDGGPVPRRQGRGRARPQPVRLAGGGRAGHGARARHRARPLRHAAAGARHGRGDPARARGIRAATLRGVAVRAVRPAARPRPGGGARVPAPRRHAAEGRRAARAADAGGDPGGDRDPRPRRVLSRRDSGGRRHRRAGRRRRDHAPPTSPTTP